MPRKRTPSPEQQKTDRIIARALANAIEQLAIAYPNDFGLQQAWRGIREFEQSAIRQPKSRTRKPKPAEAAPTPGYRDGKSAAAHDDARELTHHSV
jgi:hypothetical protein